MLATKRRMLTWYQFLPATEHTMKSIAVGDVIEETVDRIVLKLDDATTYYIDRRAIFSDEDVIE